LSLPSVLSFNLTSRLGRVGRWRSRNFTRDPQLFLHGSTATYQTRELHIPRPELTPALPVHEETSMWLTLGGGLIGGKAPFRGKGAVFGPTARICRRSPKAFEAHVCVSRASAMARFGAPDVELPPA
jgi:hypothetical protein